jgi:hypothetical protein
VKPATATLIGAKASSTTRRGNLVSDAIGDVLDLRHSLHRKPTEAKTFYEIYCGLIALAAGLVLNPGAPLGRLTNPVQSLVGMLLQAPQPFYCCFATKRRCWALG